MLLSLALDNVANSVPITLGVVIAVMVVLFAAIAVVAIINPRRACAARVTVVVLSVCLYVCPNTLFWQYAQLEV